MSLSLAQNNLNAPQYMYKEVENTQKSSSVLNAILESSSTSTTCQSHSLVARTHEEYRDRDMIKDPPNECSSLSNQGTPGVIARLRAVNSTPNASQFIHSSSDNSTDDTLSRGHQQVHSSSLPYMYKAVENTQKSSSVLNVISESSTLDTVIGKNDRWTDKDVRDTALPLSSTTTRPKLSIPGPDIPQDAATSSHFITTLTTSMRTSSYIVNSEYVCQQLARTSSCNDGPLVDQSQTTTLVHPLSSPGENNPIAAQPSIDSFKNTRQLNPAPNIISPNSSLPEGVYTTAYECEEPCGRDEVRDLPGRSSSTSKLKDDKGEILVDCTFQVIEETRNYRSDMTGAREKESQVYDKVAVLISLLDPGDLLQDTDVSAMSKYASSNYSTDNSNGYAYLDNSSQQSNNPPGMKSVPPASPVSIKDDSKAVGISHVVEKSVSSDDNHSTPCAEGIPCVEPRENDYMKAEQTIASATSHSNITQTSCRTENQDDTSFAAGTRCHTRESCDTSSKPSDDCGLKKIAATDCGRECCSTADFLPVDSCCPGPKGLPSEPCVLPDAGTDHLQCNNGESRQYFICCLHEAMLYAGVCVTLAQNRQTIVGHVQLPRRPMIVSRPMNS
ncbi:uncharacterized protein EDB93DRAFT_1108699 [Suillus bovinus]|uniref:uncharacterized protein n=1 Tax=Suillus bovinus TaxID=48563 RepID=UPI001B86B25B|nr:uncharacterized protein EDB93DRAFT_1108699 [Suillus bovinus]KAG2129409.1 hypothetical protein EDB93DRAFT_1108699 [Suillus bovinus]